MHIIIRFSNKSKTQLRLKHITILVSNKTFETQLRLKHITIRVSNNKLETRL